MAVKQMTDEDKKASLEAIRNSKEPTKEQEKTAENTMRGADGNYDISKLNLSKMFSDKANERGYTDNTTGEKKSYNKGSKWQAYIDKNITDPAAKADMEKQIQDIVSANPNMSPKELKFRLRAVESNLRRRYPNGVSKNFDISGNMFDSTMAKDLLALGLKGGSKPAETKQPDTATPPAAETPKPETSKGPTTNDELNIAFKKIKNKQASDADLALFSKYSEEQLKKMGFGPISIAAIKGKKEEPKPTPTQPAQQKTTGESAESIALRSKQDIDGISDEDLRRIEAEADKKYSENPELRQNYIENQLAALKSSKAKSKGKNDKINKKIAKLEEERATHENLMKQYPNDVDIQKAQQMWIDDINKSIEKLRAKLN